MLLLRNYVSGRTLPVLYDPIDVEEPESSDTIQDMNLNMKLSLYTFVTMPHRLTTVGLQHVR